VDDRGDPRPASDAGDKLVRLQGGHDEPELAGSATPPLGRIPGSKPLCAIASAGIVAAVPLLRFAPAALPAALLAGLASVIVPAGCEDLRCCNSCARHYTVGDGDEPYSYPGVSIVGLEEGGNECEIGDVPRGIPDGLHTLRVRIDSRSEAGEGGTSYAVEVLEHAQGDAASSLCPEDQVLDAETLVTRDEAVGATVCLLDDVSALASCTEKSCALGS